VLTRQDKSWKIVFEQSTMIADVPRVQRIE
jgi:hypothetical protein